MKVSNSINRQCFEIKVAVELDLYPLETCLKLFAPLESFNYPWLKAQKALLYYNHRGMGNY
jgi:hypothetical protein